MFKDEARIHVVAGDGGDGIVNFRREKFEPHGGPAGGDGGRGGDIVVVVGPHLNSLTSFQHKIHFQAEAGGSGGSFNKTGASGDALEILVPAGTLVRDEETGQQLADLTRVGQRVVIASGGRGGRGNARFKSSTNQAPRVAEKGEPGDQRWVTLELRLIADIGLVGVPNAGKSTLLSVVSNARPKIGAYPFTTLTPNLGVVHLGDQEMVLADIPGLIEGAHQGIGLGHNFLRHIQRTRLLIHLLDGASEDPIVDFAQIQSELVLFDPELKSRPQIIVLNKIDLPQAQEKWSRVEAHIQQQGLPIYAISAITREGVQELINKALETLAALPPPQVEDDQDAPVFRMADDDQAFNVTREGEAYRVLGAAVERAAQMTYWDYDEAIVRFHKLLTAMGVTDALREEGVEEGDTVLIADFELEWSE